MTCSMSNRWVCLLTSGLVALACTGAQPSSPDTGSQVKERGRSAGGSAGAGNGGNGGVSGTSSAVAAGGTSSSTEGSGVTAAPASHDTALERQPSGPPAELGMPVGFVVLGPDRHAPVSTGGAGTASLRLVSVRLDELPSVRKIMQGYYEVGGDPFSALPQGLKKRLKTHALRQGDTAVDVFGIAGGEFVLAALEAPASVPRVALFQRGELATLLKLGEESGLVWVTSSRDGRPMPNAEITLRQGKSVRFQGYTNADGLVRLPPERSLRLQYVPGREQQHADWSNPIEVIAKSGKSITLVSETWNTGVEPWLFDLPESYYRGQDAVRGNVTAERGIYRPGDRVHLLGVLRRRLANGKLAAPAGRVAVSVLDPDGNPIHTTSARLTEFGTFREELGIPKTARLGRYSIVAARDGAELRGRFEVGEYRAVRFEVKLPPAAKIDLKKDKISLPVAAAYLYGSPVANGSVGWTISARPKSAFGDWAQGYALGGGEVCGGYYCEADPNADLVQVASGETTLDARGNGVLEAPTEQLNGSFFPTSQALDLVVEASVQDAGGDVVTGRSTQALYRTRALVGLASDVWVVNPKQGFPLKLLVTAHDGKPKAAEKVRLSLVRRKWVGVATDHADQRRYQGGYEDEVVSTRTVTSAGHAQAIHFALPGGGEYRVDAALEGETVGATQSVWAYGGGAYGVWENNARMRMRADRESYRPGERARLYAEVPYEKAWGLLTLEREGILEARVVKLEGAGTPLEIELDERRIPNVFASLAVVPSGLGEKNPAAGPPLRIGYQELEVSAETRRLTVAVSPKTARARPGQVVDVAVRVTDSGGRPARAEVTLWAADEGVLKLTGYATPDPFVPAYERHSHAVRTSASLLRWVVGTGDDYSEYGGDAAGATDGNAAFRSRFLATAFFSKPLVTDANGQATVKLPLPDNLTRWRVMAAVADAGERFGSGEASIETAKPLQIEPALPRFLTRGDTFDATVMVHNRTDHDGRVEVALTVSGATLVGSPKTSVELERGAQAPVRFALRADTVGRARFRAAASLGDERDGFDVELPVNAPTFYQTDVVGEGRLDAPRTVSFEMPKTAEPGLAELEVAVAPGVLAAISSGLEALIDYPHGCVEQTTSRLIPMVLLEEILRSSGDSRLATKEHRAKLEHAVRHVLDHQNDDGGFGLWPTSNSEGFLTAYALFGLFTAQDHGYAVPKAALGRGLEYLAKHASDGDDLHGQFGSGDTHPFAAYVLASAKHDDGGLRAKLAGKRTELSRFGAALLGAAFAERKEPERAGLLKELGEARRKTALGTLIADQGRPDDVFDYGRDLRATAAAVHALALDGRIREADDLVAGILDQRERDGSWGTTYNNLWALHALVDYAERTPQGASDGTVKVAVGGVPVTDLVVGKSARYQQLRIAADRLPAPGARGELTLSGPRGSSLRYTARLRFASSLATQKAVDHGLAVKRTLVDAQTGAAVVTPAQGQLLRVRLEITTPEARKQVALIDRLPAGFEPVDTALVTSAQDARDGSPSYYWVWRELHDDRVTHFADFLPQGTHTVEYLARASRKGTFVRPAASAEMMYRPEVYGVGAVETVVVR